MQLAIAAASYIKIRQINVGQVDYERFRLQLKATMNRWGNRSNEASLPNFKQLFESHHQALDLLSLTNFLEDAKTNATEFTQILLTQKNRQILHQLLEIAINPYNFSQKQGKKIDNKITHAAIEILTNLSEEFIEFVFEAEADQSKEDEVVQIQKEYPMLITILKIAGEGQLESTALAYFSKIITPFIYQKPAEMLNFFTQQALSLIVRYFWSSEMSELIGKVLQSQTQKSFFQEEKANFIKKVIRCIEQFQDNNTIEQTIQSFSGFMANLVQKHDDKYEKEKYAKLLKKIIEDSQKFEFLISHLQKHKHNRVIKSQLLHSIQSYLKIHLPSTHSSNEDQQNQLQPIILNAKFVKLLQQHLQKHPAKDFVSDIRLQLINYYKVVKMLLTVHPQSTEKLINGQFLRESLQIMKQEANNNILHNLQREIIIKALQQSPKVCNIFQEINLFEEIKSTITQRNSLTSYANQLFLIFQVFSQKCTLAAQSPWKDLQQTLANKRKFYATPIATNLKSDEDKWNNLQHEIIIKPESKIESTAKPKTTKPKNANNQPFTMVSRLDEMQGTEVLSQEEEDGFPADSGTKTNHYYDDLGMPQLPLDSDKSQEGELKADSLQNIPQNIKENSGINIPIDNLPQTLNQGSNQNICAQQDDFDMPLTLGQDSIRFQGQPAVDQDDLPDTLGQNSNKQIALEGKQHQNHSILQVAEFEMKNVSLINQQSFQPKEELCLSGFNELTVSINIAEEGSNKSSQPVAYREEIQVLLQAKYQLQLSTKKQ